MSLVNQAGWERTARIVLAAVLLYLGWGGVVTGVTGTVLKIIGFLPLLTGLSGWCPLYTAIGFRTNRA
jgi:hypothetical protein